MNLATGAGGARWQEDGESATEVQASRPVLVSINGKTTKQQSVSKVTALQPGGPQGQGIQDPSKVPLQDNRPLTATERSLGA